MTVVAPAAEPAWLSLFHREAFHALNVREGDRLVTMRATEDDRVVAAASGVLRDGTLTIGFSAPFGGIDFARPREAPERVCVAIDDLLAQATAAGAERIEVRGRGASWSANEAVVQFALLNRGFGMAAADLSYAIDLRAFPSIDDYVAALKSPARRALRHAEREPFTFAPAGSDWAPAYAVLERNRRQHGRRLALSLDYLHRARAAFADRVQLWELRHDDALCAAALVFAVTPERWYVQAWGDAGHALRRSPMNELVRCVVAEALATGVEVIDLGRTTEHAPPGEPLRVSAGLAQFKQSILARSELRPVLVR